MIIARFLIVGTKAGSATRILEEARINEPSTYGHLDGYGSSFSNVSLSAFSIGFVI